MKHSAGRSRDGGQLALSRPGRADGKAAELSGRAKIRAGQARKEAAARAGSVRGQLAGKTAAPPGSGVCR
jgi:hypothetical protein